MFPYMRSVTRKGFSVSRLVKAAVLSSCICAAKVSSKLGTFLSLYSMKEQTAT